MKVLITCWLLVFSFAAQAADTLSEAKERLITSHETLKSAQDDFQSESKAGRLSKAEKQDYELYIADLAEDLWQNCEDYRLAGGKTSDFKGVCDPKNKGSGRAANINLKNEKTHAEGVSSIDNELRASMGQFDEMILREQERVKSATPSSRDDGSQGQYGRDGDTGEGASEGKEGKKDQDGREGKQGPEGTSKDQKDGSNEGKDQKRSKDPRSEQPGASVGQPSQGNGMPGPKGGGQKGQRTKTPHDVGDGSDDDVVARQLREAAENETDPKLRERLWEEYRHYKKGL